LWNDCDDTGVRWLLQLVPAYVAEIAMANVTLLPLPVPLQALLAALDHTRIQHDLAQLCAADFAGRRIGTDGHDRATQ
jgi:hypothetical protein